MSRPAVVEKVSRSFVPVAVDRFQVGESQAADGELWRRIQHQRKAFQGVWIVSPDGQVLASQSGSSDGKVEPWTREVLWAIDVGLQKFGAVTPRAATAANRLAERGVGIEPDGGIRVALYCGILRGGRRDGPAATEILPLSAEDLRAIVPGGIEEQMEWTVADAVARKFCRALSPYSEPTIVPRPEHLKLARLTGRVQSISAGRAQIHLTGAWESAFRGGERPGPISASVTAQGLASYDVKQMRLRSVLLVFGGDYHHHSEGAQRIGAVAEWAEAATRVGQAESERPLAR